METRKASRTVIINEYNKTIIIDIRNGEYYKIPGGKIEKGETEEQAAKREAIEEAGCNVEIIKKIGEHQFSDPVSGKGVIHHSVCFLARKVRDRDNEGVGFDEWEKKNKFRAYWKSFDEAIEMFKKSETEDPFGKEINKRDLEFLLEAKKELNL